MDLLPYWAEVLGELMRLARETGRAELPDCEVTVDSEYTAAQIRVVEDSLDPHSLKERTTRVYKFMRSFGYRVALDDDSEGRIRVIVFLL